MKKKNFILLISTIFLLLPSSTNIYADNIETIVEQEEIATKIEGNNTSKEDNNLSYIEINQDDKVEEVNKGSKLLPDVHNINSMEIKIDENGLVTEYYGYNISDKEKEAFLKGISEANNSVAPKTFDLSDLSYNYEVDKNSVPTIVTVGDRGKFRKIYQDGTINKFTYDSLYVSLDPTIVKVNKDGTWVAVKAGETGVGVVPLDNKKAIGYNFFTELKEKGYKLIDIIQPSEDHTHTDDINKYNNGRWYKSSVFTKKYMNSIQNISNKKDEEASINVNIKNTNKSISINTNAHMKYENPKTLDIKYNKTYYYILLGMFSVVMYVTILVKKINR